MYMTKNDYDEHGSILIERKLIAWLLEKYDKYMHKLQIIKYLIKINKLIFITIVLQQFFSVRKNERKYYYY